MKQIALDKLYLTPKLLITALVILTLSVFSMIATAADAEVGDAGGKTLSERFNHMATGFPLTGMHASAECGSCHVGGIFKGTARNCSGCHTKGQRVVATAMSSRHLVTTDPCEVCHTNTVTFYGARYNHGRAVSHQCTTCHNGFTATGRPSNHSSANKASKSCDYCHRTYAWLPSSWNHFDTSSSCETCHVAGGEGAAYVKNNIGGSTPKGYAHLPANNGIACRSCHRSYTTWYGAIYDHAGAGSTCTSCHGTAIGVGVSATPKTNTTVHQQTTDECSACHTTTATWSGALGAKPYNHIKYNTGTLCGSCHVGTSVKTGASLHSYVTTYTCNGCHQKGAQTACDGTPCLGNIQTSSHEGSKTCNSSGCHSSYTTWNK